MLDIFLMLFVLAAVTCAVIDRDQVLHVARLARLRLSDEEVETMTGELSGILEHVDRIGVIAEPFAELLVVVTEQHAVHDARLERRLVEQRSGQHVQRVEPPARLADVLHDEVAREVPVEHRARVRQARDGANRAALDVDLLDAIQHVERFELHLPAIRRVWRRPVRRSARTDFSG